MKLHQLKKTQPKRRHVGRGISAGQGKTAGRGTKGQKSRTGHNIPKGFEGGQTKLYMRLPKLRGLNNRIKRSSSATISLSQLETNFKAGERVSLVTLRSKKLIDRSTQKVKIVARGELTKKLKFSGVSFSKVVHDQIYKTKKEN
ncbi:50S ribosomal protein L15 [Candidatus Berkelbacteria bacterium]|nr:50S ribosomal protein L15 [Candidatus Berkelbacteria bacterium]